MIVLAVVSSVAFGLLCLLVKKNPRRVSRMGVHLFRPGTPLFAIGYKLYQTHVIGNYLHAKSLRKARQQFPSGHSEVQVTEMNGFRIRPIPFLDDNLAYLVIDKATNTAVVIDPGDPDVVQYWIEKEAVDITAIFTTHKHWDHSGGNVKLKTLYKNIAVYGHSNDRVPGVTHNITDKECIEIGGLRFTSLFTPGHTVGHTAYLLHSPGSQSPDCVFTGDLLFLGGCGRMFEGPASIMLQSLDKICDLKGETLIWPGHEYAKNNLEFASFLEPDNRNVVGKFDWVKAKRKEKHLTAPSSVAEEKTYNPFLRTASVSLLSALGIDDVEATGKSENRARVLAELREQKDKYMYKL